MSTTYRAVDHVMVRLLDIEPLFSLFGTVFELPVSWPRQHNDFATFGWVHVGNTDLEFWASTNNSDLPCDRQPPVIHGFALDPADLSASISTLAEAGLRCKEPRPYRTPNDSGELVTNFTNSVLLDLSSDSCCVFFCEWHANGTIFPWPERLTSVERRARDQQLFAQRAGGPLGLIGLSCIEMSTPKVAETAARWRAVSGSSASTSEVIELTADMALQLRPGARHAIQSLTFDVRSLEVASAFLASRNLLGVSSERDVTIAPTATDGLRLKLRQA